MLHVDRRAFVFLLALFAPRSRACATTATETARGAWFAIESEGHILRLRAARLASDDASRSEAVLGASKAFRRAIKADDVLAEAYYGLGLSYLIS